MITENLSTLKIHRLTQEQYDRALEVGNIDPNALYLTPEKEPIFIQNDEPVDAEDGALWLDLDAIGQSSGSGSVFYDGEMVYSQNHEPIGAPDGTLWVDLDDDEGVAGSGGSGGLIVTFNVANLTASHSASEIYAAVNSRTVVVGLVSDSNIAMNLLTATETQAAFHAPIIEDGNANSIIITVADDKTLTYNQEKAIGVPSGGTAGQVLTIGADGKLVWSNPAVDSNLPVAEELMFG